MIGRYLWQRRVAIFALMVFLQCSISDADETKITELAKGVYFRRAQTSPIFTGCNQGWVVFKDYVLIIDANFPGQADEVVASIRKTTDKPIRFVFDTHYHGDHADGNMQYSKIGATIVAQERSQPLFQTKGKEGFARAQVDRTKEYGSLSYELPSLYFTHKLIFDDGEQRVELIFFGHGHTAGDAVAWLPHHGILFTGDACVNGPFNYTGDGDTESWIAALGAMQELGVKTLCPGHGESGGPEVIEKQRRYFVELREAIKKGMADKKSLDQIKKEIALPFYKEWTGVEVSTRTENIEHVYSELTAVKEPIKNSTSFLDWAKMPGAEGYGAISTWDMLGKCDTDLRLDALADLYLTADIQSRKEIRDAFSGQREELESMWMYVRRAAARMADEDSALLLRRGLAVAAIEGGRIDYRDTIVSLVLLRYGAELQKIDIQPYFSQIQEWVASETRPLFENARTHKQSDVLYTVKSSGPPEWTGFPGKKSSWNGYDRYDFEVDGKPVLVVVPREAAPGKPWVWHGEFFGHKPAPDIELLGKGFHVVAMNIPDLFGAPQAVAHWNALHKYLTTQHQFSSKPALVGVSRGGLYCYNWAAENPDSVSCIYGDAPVCDLRSWPLGKGHGDGNANEIPKLMKVYGVDNEKDLLAKAISPIDKLEPLAKANVPLLHVYGDADTGVPWDENTGIVAERYKKLGGSMTLIAKPGVGHVHGLDDSTPIIDFIFKHASVK